MPIDFQYRPISDPSLKDKNINNFKNAIAKSMIITDKSIIKDYDSMSDKLSYLRKKLPINRTSDHLVSGLCHVDSYISEVLSAQKRINQFRYYRSDIKLQIKNIQKQIKNIQNDTEFMPDENKILFLKLEAQELVKELDYVSGRYISFKEEYKKKLLNIVDLIPEFISDIKDSYYELFRNIKNKDDETYKIMHEASQWLAMALDSSMDAICNDKETILIPDVDPRSNYLAHKVVDVDTLAETLTGLVNEEKIERNIFSEISSFCNISDKHILDSAKEYLKKYLNEHIRLIDS
ncbi:hypothetical protein L3V83_14535, partial [Thiotrichales bacterium 19X7-9]|nr:hypothetical protein [Thiotrichales bacterium 19X7-9]